MSTVRLAKRPRGCITESVTSRSVDAPVLRSELTTLNAIVSFQGRPRIYRHHVFFRWAQLVLRHVRRAVTVGEGPGHTAWLLDQLLTAGEHAANEASTRRVDTLPIALALLGIYARLHYVLSQRSPEDPAAIDKKARRMCGSSDGSTSFGPDLLQEVRCPEAVLVIPPHLRGGGQTLGSLVDQLNANHLESLSLRPS